MDNDTKNKMAELHKRLIDMLRMTTPEVALGSFDFQLCYPQGLEDGNQVYFKRLGDIAIIIGKDNGDNLKELPKQWEDDAFLTFMEFWTDEEVANFIYSSEDGQSHHALRGNLLNLTVLALTFTDEESIMKYLKLFGPNAAMK